MLTSTRLYKYVVRSLQENSSLLLTISIRLKGLSAIEEVVAKLSKHFLSNMLGSITLDNVFKLDAIIQDYISIKDIVIELRY